MNESIYIYGLIHPYSKSVFDVRYFGKSVNPKRRFIEHLNAARSNSPAPVYHWMRKLLAKGIEPKLKIYEQCESFNWQMIEKYYINYFREHSRWELLNIQDGGEATPKGSNHWLGRKHSQESKDKMREAALKRLERDPNHLKKASLFIKPKPKRSAIDQQIKNIIKEIERIERREAKKLLTKTKQEQRKREHKAMIELKKKQRLTQPHPLSKLNEQQIKEIRTLLADGKNNAMIASLYNVSRRTIYSIKNNFSYRQIK